jgi:hypothetical protein
MGEKEEFPAGLSARSHSLPPRCSGGVLIFLSLVPKYVIGIAPVNHNYFLSLADTRNESPKDHRGELTGPSPLSPGPQTQLDDHKCP